MYNVTILVSYRDMIGNVRIIIIINVRGNAYHTCFIYNGKVCKFCNILSKIDVVGL